MTRKSNILGTMALFVVALMSGCASLPEGSLLVSHTSDLPSIQEQFSQQLSQIKVGMSLQEFRQIIPEAHAVAQDGKSTTFELVGTQRYVSRGDIIRHNLLWGFGSPKARTLAKSIYFYFYDDELIKWGEPKEVSHEPISKESDADAPGRIIKGYKLTRDASGEPAKDKDGSFIFVTVYEDE